MASTGTFGRHVLAEIRDGSFDLLDDVIHIEQVLLDAAVHCGATVLNSKPTKFEPQGCSVVITLAESHISIHTFPEEGYASFDAYTCGQVANPEVILDYFVSNMNYGCYAQYVLIPRGIGELKIKKRGMSAKPRREQSV